MMMMMAVVNIRGWNWKHQILFLNIRKRQRVGSRSTLVLGSETLYRSTNKDSLGKFSRNVSCCRIITVYAIGLRRWPETFYACWSTPFYSLRKQIVHNIALGELLDHPTRESLNVIICMIIVQNYSERSWKRSQKRQCNTSTVANPDPLGYENFSRIMLHH